MNLISNINNSNHRKAITRLISLADEIILCSGWIKYSGLKKLLPKLKKVIADRKTSVTVYSNKAHTEEKCTEALAKITGVNHVIIDNDLKYFHSKLYYFVSKDNYYAIIGSANITEGGLVGNDELSIQLSGKLNDDNHIKIKQYIENLKTYTS
ncbi:phospholipase D family protein [Plesiomonas shigelloides]|uniref:phospholipase D family protein n=1 Tax=Plesiomonas shigelloides TaxID=703 RepID=UPI003260B4AE